MSTTTTVRQQNQLGVLNASDDKLLKKLQSKFTEEEQQLFVQSFRMYLNHDQETEYIVDLDDVWEWIGFSTKQKAKDLLLRHFMKDNHYKITLNQAVERVHGGQNKETILMNIKTFLKMCLKAGTKKADDVHNYYIKMAETLHEYLLENAKRQAKLEREKALIESHKRKSVNYFGTIGKIDGIDIWKFGWSNDVWTRIEAHKKELGEDFVVECIVECERNVLLEKKLKARGEIVQRRVKKVIKGKAQTELVQLDEDFQPEDVKGIMDEINEGIQTEVDKQRRHEERMMELNIEMKRLDIQSQQIQLQSQQLQARSSSYAQSRPSQNARPRGPIKVSQYTLDGNFIKTFNSIKEAAKAVKCDRNSLGKAIAEKQTIQKF
jgi:hypothetical protein